MDFGALEDPGREGLDPMGEDKFGALGEDPLADDGMGGSPLMSALTGAGYNPTPEQLSQIEAILGQPGSGMETTAPEDPMGGDPMGGGMPPV